MTDHPLVTRRMIIRDMGKAGLALMVLGTAACSGDSTQASTSSSLGGGSSTSPGVDPTTASTAAGSSTSTTDGEGHEWHRVNLDFVSAFILYRSGEATIVDTGVGGSQAAIEAALGEIGLGWGDVSGLVVTHLHPDHQGSVPAVIAATTESLPWFAGAADLAGIDSPTEGQAVGDGDTVGAGLQIIETPGHTAGHISVLDPISGILVAGDALNGTNGGVAGPNADFSDDMGLANASVSKLAGFDYEVALFGHGEPVTAGASGLVADLAESIG
jgi:glyoxylase-like metal-dependent hydrolase (beta-lactamase superfamily II)